MTQTGQVQEASITASIAAIGNGLGLLGEELSQLRVRLSPVSEEVLEKDDTAVARTPATCPLLGELQDREHMVAALRAQVDTMLTRLRV